MQFDIISAILLGSATSIANCSTCCTHG